MTNTSGVPVPSSNAKHDQVVSNSCSSPSCPADVRGYARRRQGLVIPHACKASSSASGRLSSARLYTREEKGRGREVTDHLVNVGTADKDEGKTQPSDRLYGNTPRAHTLQNACASEHVQSRVPFHCVALHTSALYACMHLFVFLFFNVCMYVRIYVCMYLSISVSVFKSPSPSLYLHL